LELLNINKKCDDSSWKG